MGDLTLAESRNFYDSPGRLQQGIVGSQIG
jgi:hypothetical protein